MAGSRPKPQEFRVRKTTGSTTDAFVTVLTMSRVRSLSALIENTGGANGLSWRIRAVHQLGGTKKITEGGASSNVAFGADDQKNFSSPKRRVFVEVKSQSAGNSTTFKLAANFENGS